ncbi:Spy/CpxP family protein refolding chaperone [Gilvimarinus algae]|uniref:Spy/CpxP family protein refolding chaperone n=1 Tax=Gilvimarinus algae TaxID=3058037 RepID=A0ABT8TCM0_9GAMM|nr:Spy/CpxP family protein refolding chaperone [Gilvimarinus sp. SDUM040014]MDO3381847.1 Spy/CpxP family protein refolding chaperone [Gilvimarinus sp. SDUM040014]
MKRMISSLTLCTALALPFAALGAAPGEHFDGTEFLLKDRVAEKLELTDQQRSQIQVLIDNHRAVYPPSRELWREKREAVEALMQAAEFDEAAARALLDADDERRLADMKLRHSLSQVLTDEQKDTLKAMGKRMKERRFGDKPHRH